jgi:exosortase
MKYIQQFEITSLTKILPFLGVLGPSALLLRAVLSRDVALSLSDERYTYILIVPVISAVLIWLRREEIFSEIRASWWAAIPFAIGIALSFMSSRIFPVQEYDLALATLGIVISCVALFFLCFGPRAARRAEFALLFLILMIPIPVSVMDMAAVALQTASAEASNVLFKVVGVPVLREGFRFSLPGVQIEVAEECSGIRSSLSLLLTSLVAGHLCLKSRWNAAALVFFTIPVTIAKNGLRIVTISLLGTYVDRGFLHGNLHKYGGLPFGLLALAMLASILLLMRRFENTATGASNRLWLSSGAAQGRS